MFQDFAIHTPINPHASQYSAGWTGNGGFRYHVWFNPATLEIDAILYKKPPAGTNQARVKHLNLNASAHAKTLEFLRANITREAVNKARAEAVADEQRTIDSARDIEVERYRKNLRAIRDKVSEHGGEVVDCLVLLSNADLMLIGRGIRG